MNPRILCALCLPLTSAGIESSSKCRASHVISALVYISALAFHIIDINDSSSNLDELYLRTVTFTSVYFPGGVPVPSDRAVHPAHVALRRRPRLRPGREAALRGRGPRPLLEEEVRPRRVPVPQRPGRQFNGHFKFWV